MANVNFVEEFRPKEFSEVVGLDPNFAKFVENPKTMPHFLFVGTQGSGKTTLAKIIIEKTQSQSLIMNSSMERGIITVRYKVSEFVRTKSYNGNPKIVFLDECDGLTSQAMDSLRNLMEQYNLNSRFILTANHEELIIEPLRSRCVIIRFGKVNEQECYDKLSNILKVKGLEFDKEALELLISKFNPDIRSMINAIQKIKTLNKKLTVEEVNSASPKFAVIIDLVKRKDLQSARDMITEDEADSIFYGIYSELMLDDNIPEAKKEKVNFVAQQCNFYGRDALFKKISADAFIMGLSKII